MTRKRDNGENTPTLPAFLRPILWEYEFADMSWDADRDTIVFKILSSGDWNAVRWLRSELGAGQLSASGCWPRVDGGWTRHGFDSGNWCWISLAGWWKNGWKALMEGYGNEGSETELAP